MSKKLGRPKSKNIKVRSGFTLDRIAFDAIQKLSKESGISRSKIINDIIIKELNLNKTGGKKN